MGLPSPDQSLPSSGEVAGDASRPPASESIIPPIEGGESGSNLEAVMKRHMAELIDRNNSVEGRLCVVVGEGRSQALVFTTPVFLEDLNGYQMVVTRKGIKVIKSITNSHDYKRSAKNLQEVIADAIDRNHDPGGGYENRPGSQSPRLTIGRLTISRHAIDDYQDNGPRGGIEFVDEPPPEVIKALIAAERNRFQKLTAEQHERNSKGLELAEDLKQI